MKYAIGLDVGIASVGFAAVRLDGDDKPYQFISLGSRIFETAEQPKTGESLAAPRRMARSARRRLRRKAHRKERIRKLITDSGLLTEAQLDQLIFVPKDKDFVIKPTDIYKLRLDALDFKISNAELARIMIHLSQRRGFKSNAKSQKKDEGKMKGAISENSARMKDKGYRTVGEMLCCDEMFSAYKRNKGENYLNTVSRDMIEDEARMIFSRQRELGSINATEELENAFLDILLSQRSFIEGPGKGPKSRPSPWAFEESLSAEKVGKCEFETNEPRAPIASYSFEYFRLLQEINHLRITDVGSSRPLTEEERASVIELAHKKKEIKLDDIKKSLKLNDEATFNYSGKRAFAKMPAYNKMREILGKDVITTISVLQRDEIARLFTILRNEQKLRDGLEKLGLVNDIIDSLIANLDCFSKFGHLSVKALNKLIPFLEQGLTYDKACEAAGYNFKGHGTADESKKSLVSLKSLSEEMENTITSPVSKRAVSQCAKVINAIIREMGESPVYINIELAREMSKDFDERRKIEREQEQNRADNERIFDRIKEYKSGTPGGYDLVKLKLYEKQGGICPYSQSQMDIRRLFDVGYVDVDHIIPYSKCFDDTYNNKVLVLASENRQKGNRLPLEYLTGKRRDSFIVWVNSSSLPLKKKQKLLKEKFSEEDEAEFKDRNLTDTKTISRFLYNYLRENLSFNDFSDGRKEHVMPINGAFTDMLRKRWGLQKVRGDGDLHHAQDAAVIVCASRPMMYAAGKYYHNKELIYVQDDGSGFAVSEKTGEIKKEFPMPWRHFRDELLARLSPRSQDRIRDLARDGKLTAYDRETIGAVKDIFVSRMPNRKVTGAAHKDTVKSPRNNGIALKSVPLASLKLKNGEIEDYYYPESDKLLYSALVERLTAFGGDGAKAFAEPFNKPKSDGTPGPLVKKVKITETPTRTVGVHKDAETGAARGVADNDSIVRTDVFYIKGDGYYLVPIYVADTLLDELPNRAIVAYKSYESWKPMSDEHFIFSLYPNDLVFIRAKNSINFARPKNIKDTEKSKLPEKIVLGETFMYYKGVNISTASISGITHDGSYYASSIGAKTLPLIEKHTVDILGNISKIGKEKRLPFEIER